jgi:hypothetical protein
MQSTTENPNAAMYAAEEQRRQRIRAQLEKDAPARAKLIADTYTAMEVPPTPTQLENDVAMMLATGAEYGDPMAAAAAAPPAARASTPAHPPQNRS